MDPQLRKKWGKTIRLMREVKDKRDGTAPEKGLGLMAEALEVSPQTVSRWETGVLTPRDGKKIEIARYLEVSPEVLFPLVEVTS